MKRFILPLIGVLAALGAAVSIARTYPRPQSTDPPAPPPVSDFPNTVAAVGLVETSTENISIGTPLSGVVAKVFVTAGQMVRAGDPLFELDMRHLRADLKVNQQALAVARARVEVAQAHVDDLKRQLEFAERIEDKRAMVGRLSGELAHEPALASPGLAREQHDTPALALGARHQRLQHAELGRPSDEREHRGQTERPR